ncbi:hypothetical protein HANVADRAFT_425 [Hanseniaspora valbyensis NRRL Y-1626]|uniref:Uncharacterized protein n=1 Tax=Hanseniaspora valbyensis NRRL Y-1626 TaxID=766949 RepID=A0A1B7TJ61_9ASCO|nr:hypothetical protein HANVADRAFT_425 [Hanseniaspora valbyensis NRRL Y-1626]
MFPSRILLSTVSKTHAPQPVFKTWVKTVGLIAGFVAPIGFYSFYYQWHDDTTKLLM